MPTETFSRESEKTPCKAFGRRRASSSYMVIGPSSRKASKDTSHPKARGATNKFLPACKSVSLQREVTLEVVGNDDPRQMMAHDECERKLASSGQNPAYRRSAASEKRAPKGLFFPSKQACSESSSEWCSAPTEMNQKRAPQRALFCE